MALGLVVVMLGGADAASAFLTANTIDDHATYKKHGKLVLVTGPIAMHARRARLDQCRRPPAGDRGPRAEPVEGPLHGRAPALAGQGAHPPRDPL